MTGKPVVSVACAVLLALTATACERDSMGPAGSLSPSESAELAELVAASAGSILDDQASSAASSARGELGTLSTSGEVRTEFTITRACPKGGSVTVAGETLHTLDFAARSYSAQTTATQTAENCTFPLRRVDITINGAPHIAITASRSLVDRAPTGLQTHTQKGAFHWSTSDGRSGTCSVDLSATYDPAARVHVVKGASAAGRST